MVSDVAAGCEGEGGVMDEGGYGDGRMGPAYLGCGAGGTFERCFELCSGVLGDIFVHASMSV